eukprot:2170880-Rhodomonas_salina.1
MSGREKGRMRERGRDAGKVTRGERARIRGGKSARSRATHRASTRRASARRASTRRARGREKAREREREARARASTRKASQRQTRAHEKTSANARKSARSGPDHRGSRWRPARQASLGRRRSGGPGCRGESGRGCPSWCASRTACRSV